MKIGMRVVSIALMCGLTAACHGLNDPKAKWDEKTQLFTTPAGRMTVKLPGLPYERSVTYGTLTNGREFVYEKDDFVLAATSGDIVAYYDPADPMASQRNLNAMVDEKLRAINGKQSMNYPIGLSGGMYPGKHVDGTIAPYGQLFTMRCYVDPYSKGIFVLEARGPKNRVVSKEAKQFLDSLVVLPKPQE